jgi:signal transduction histidine kinase
MGNTCCVLLVDDDRNFSGLIKAYLESIIQARAVLLHTLDRFWHTLKENSFDNILMDSRLPNSTGIEMTEYLKNREFSLPVVMLTGEGSEQIAVKGICDGAIEQAGCRAQQVAGELLQFSKPTSDQNEWIEINKTIERGLTLLRGNLSSIDVDLTVKFGEDLPLLNGNAQQIQDLWVTFLLLAINACANGKFHLIQIEATIPENKPLLIKFADDEGEIPKEQINNLFEPVLLPPGLGRGTGMQLSICRDIVCQHNGTITTNMSKAGTVFTIQFSGERISHG